MKYILLDSALSLNASSNPSVHSTSFTFKIYAESDYTFTCIAQTLASTASISHGRLVSLYPSLPHYSLFCTSSRIVSYHLYQLSSSCKVKGKDLIMIFCDLVWANFTASPRTPGLFHTSHTDFQVHSQLGKFNLSLQPGMLFFYHSLSSSPHFFLVSFQKSFIREAFHNYLIQLPVPLTLLIFLHRSWHPHKNVTSVVQGFLQFTSLLYPQQLEQCLVDSIHSMNICWMKE